MDTFSPSARARSEQKLYVPPHLRGILRGPVVPVVAPAPHKESHANVVPAVPPHLRGLEGNSSLKKEEWIPPHLRRACDSRCARVVEQKPVRRVFRYGPESLLPTPEPSESSVVSPPTPATSESSIATKSSIAAKRWLNPLLAEKSTRSVTALEKLLSFVPACLHDQATLAFDQYISARFLDISKQMLASYHAEKSHDGQKTSSDSPSEERKSTSSAVDLEKSEKSYTSVSPTMDVSLDEEECTLPTDHLEKSEIAHTSASAEQGAPFVAKESVTAAVVEDVGIPSNNAVNATANESFEEKDSAEPAAPRNTDDPTDTIAGAATDVALDEKEAVTPPALKDENPAPRDGESAPDTVAVATEHASLDERELPIPATLHDNAETSLTHASDKMLTSFGGMVHNAYENLKTTSPNADHEKKLGIHVSIHSTAEVSIHSAPEASPPDSFMVDEPSPTIVLDTVTASSHESCKESPITEHALLNLASGEGTVHPKFTSMNTGNVLLTGSGDEISDSEAPTPQITSDQKHRSLFSKPPTSVSQPSYIRQSHLEQQFASGENPADFDLSRVLRQSCLKIKDYRFDDNSSGLGSVGEPFDYKNGKHPDGWDLPDPKGVAELLCEMAMAHDGKGNWKTIGHWDDRPGFVHDSTYYTGILKWMEDRVQEALSSPIDFDTSTYLYISGKGYSSGTDTFVLEPESHPLAKQAKDGFTYENSDQTAFKESQAVCQKIEEKQAVDRARRKEIMKTRKESRRMARLHVPPPNLYIPKINMYLRPAKTRDMRQVSDIYNHYVKNTPIAPDLTATTREDWVSRFTAIQDDQCLPFLIAIARSQRTSSTHRSRQRYTSLPEENIVGFSFAKKYIGYEETYNGTVQMQVYVHPGHPHMGIGKNLTDKLVELLDLSHTFHNGCDYAKPDDNEIYTSVGGMMRPKQILVNIPFYPGQEEALDWQKQWLWAHFYFDQVATMPGLGEKNKKRFNVAMFTRDTGYGCRYLPRNEMTGKRTPDHLLEGFVMPEKKEDDSDW